MEIEVRPVSRLKMSIADLHNTIRDDRSSDNMLDLEMSNEN